LGSANPERVSLQTCILTVTHLSCTSLDNPDLTVV
jgi:hypothetical protein